MSARKYTSTEARQIAVDAGYREWQPVATDHWLPLLPFVGNEGIWFNPIIIQPNSVSDGIARLYVTSTDGSRFGWKVR